MQDLLGFFSQVPDTTGPFCRESENQTMTSFHTSLNTNHLVSRTTESFGSSRQLPRGVGTGKSLTAPPAVASRLHRRTRLGSDRVTSVSPENTDPEDRGWKETGRSSGADGMRLLEGMRRRCLLFEFGQMEVLNKYVQNAHPSPRSPQIGWMH